MAIELGLPTGTARRALEDLAAYDLVERHKLKKNKDLWKAINPEGEPAPKPAKAPTPEYATEDDERTQMGDDYLPDD